MRVRSFQFHKVRLKVPPTVISALDSTFQFHKVRLKVTSGMCGSCTFEVFQFHKVRLKERANSRVSNFISFQFHKVRLKGVVPKSISFPL